MKFEKLNNNSRSREEFKNYRRLEELQKIAEELNKKFSRIKENF